MKEQEAIDAIKQGTAGLVREMEAIPRDDPEGQAKFDAACERMELELVRLSLRQIERRVMAEDLTRRFDDARALIDEIERRGMH